jgi:uncharacterized membrane protein YgdD (TMEM256/DUF423 family)
MLIHAVGVMAGIALARQGVIARPLSFAALWGLILGATLFAADVAARAYLGTRIFPFAAPLGGLIMIASWLVLAVAALIALRGA